MVVTVNTDASFCPVQKVGGYAFWIKCDMGTIAKSEPIKEALNPEDCEFKALANAIHVLEHSVFNNKTIAHVVINSDCKWMFDKIGKKSDHEAGRAIALGIARIRKNNDRIKSAKKIYTLRYVKAHNGTPDARSWVNDWCDTQAKIAMNAQRKPFKPGKKEYEPVPVPGIESYSKFKKQFDDRVMSSIEHNSNIY